MNEEFEVINAFTYLGVFISKDGSEKAKVKRKICVRVKALVTVKNVNVKVFMV